MIRSHNEMEPFEIAACKMPAHYQHEAELRSLHKPVTFRNKLGARLHLLSPLIETPWS